MNPREQVTIGALIPSAIFTLAGALTAGKRFDGLVFEPLARVGEKMVNTLFEPEVARVLIETVPDAAFLGLISSYTGVIANQIHNSTASRFVRFSPQVLLVGEEVLQLVNGVGSWEDLAGLLITAAGINILHAIVKS
jgi:hypothetical protein